MHERTVRARTATGIVEGFTRDGVNRWRSIPYAQAPLGALRFRAPQPAKPWSGVRHCHGFTNCAPQQRRYTVLGVGRYQPMSEDCLTLNVVTPEAARSRTAACHGVHSRRRVHHGQLGDPADHGLVLARRGWSTYRSTTGSGPSDVWTSRRCPRRRSPSTPTWTCATRCRVAMDARQHRGIRR